MLLDNIILLLVFLCGAVIVNAVLLIFIAIPYRKVSQARGWSQTMGRVETSEIVMRSDSDGGYAPYPNVIYTYHVNGQELKNDGIQPGGELGGSSAYKTQKKYQAGMTVTIYYNPQNPSEALLERQVPVYVRWLWVALVFVNATLCCCGIVPLFGSGMHIGLPYLLHFITSPR